MTGNAPDAFCRLWSVWEHVCSPRRSYQPSLLLYRVLCCDVMLALCVSWVCVVNPVCLAASCQQTAMATGEESKAPFDLDEVKLSLCFSPVPITQEAETRRELLKSWFHRRTITQPEVVFIALGFRVGGTAVYWDDLTAEWDHGRDAVFTFLGVEVADKALAWNRLIDLLRPGTSPPCPLCCLFAPVSPLSFCLNSPNQRVWW